MSPPTRPNSAAFHSARAEADARAILNKEPANYDGTILLARALRAQGDAQGAKRLLEPLVLARPEHAFARYLLALTEDDLGNHDPATHGYRKAGELDPYLPGVWLALAKQLARAGDEKGRDRAHAQHAKYSANAPHVQSAAAALNARRFHEAEEILRNHLKGWPDDFASMAMLAEAPAKRAQYDDAVAVFERCLALAPTYMIARLNYATVLFLQHKLPEAIDQTTELLATDPDNPNYKSLRAGALALLGDFDAAIRDFDELLAKWPNDPRTWISYGNVLKGAGRQKAAVDAYRRAISLKTSLGEAWWSLSNLKNVRFSDYEVEQMRASLQGGDLSDDDRLHFHFALGKAFEDQSAFSSSFEHYRVGNALKRARLSYSADEIDLRVQRSIALFTPAFFASRRGWGHRSAEPIFVVGLPRSGSTLVEQILASHSAVEGTMELPFIMSIARRLGAEGRWSDAPAYPETLSALQPSDVQGLGEAYLDRARTQRRLGRPFFIDKMPNNFLHLGLIHLILPNAKIIDVRRGPVACGFSVFKQLFSHGQHFSFDLLEIGRYYRAYVALMAHFDVALPGRVYRVAYEKLVKSPEPEIRSLLAYCGLEFEDSCLRFYENQRSVRTASSEQVRMPIFEDGLEQWRNYLPWLGPLKDALGPNAKL